MENSERNVFAVVRKEKRVGLSWISVDLGMSLQPFYPKHNILFLPLEDLSALLSDRTAAAKAI